MFEQPAGVPLVFGHRGCSTKPENTLESFEHALLSGADGIEFDVRTTSDGVLVVIHDADLTRTTGLDGLVHRTAFETLRQGNGSVPTLGEVLDWAASHDGLLLDVEVKNLPGYDLGGSPAHDLVLEVASEIERRDLTSRTVLSSFNVHDLLAVKARSPSVRVAWITMPMVPAAELVSVADAHGIDGFHPHLASLHGQLLAETVELVSSARTCRWLMPWTVNNTDEAVRAAEAGVGGIITDEPGAVLGALTSGA
jgi:glycerophosphoryl diester phosphodiesterase